MKIKRTTNRGSPKEAVRSTEQTQTTKRPSQPSAKEVADTVSLSVDAIASRNAVDETSSIEEVAEATAADGPLPDPRATSQAILEKELAQVFREIYL